SRLFSLLPFFQRAMALPHLRTHVLMALCLISVAVFLAIQETGGLLEKRSSNIVTVVSHQSTSFLSTASLESSPTLSSPRDVQFNKTLIDSRKKWWPFRYVHPQLEAHMVMGSAVRAPDALCELMVLGHPLCDHFLTDPEQHPVRHPEGAMVECI
ncbi:Hypothetical protein, putative, partial [Bodo saltans]